MATAGTTFEIPKTLGNEIGGSGRVYFGGVDGSLYAFGIYMEH